MLCLFLGSVRATESASPAQGPIQLVHDFFPGDFEADPPPSPLTQLGNVSFFAASDVETGQNVWRTDGTAGGTERVPLSGNDGTADYAVIWGRLGQRVLWISGVTNGAGVLWAATEGGDGIALHTYFGPNDVFGTSVAIGGRFYFQDCTDTACTFFSTEGTLAETGPIPALAQFTASDQEILGSFAGRWLVFRSQRSLFAYDVARNRVLSLLPDGAQFAQAYPVGKSLFLLTNYNQLWVSRLDSPRASLLFGRKEIQVTGWRGNSLYFITDQGNLWSTEGRRETTRFYSGLGVDRFGVLADQLGSIGSTTFLPMPGYYSASLLGIDENNRKVSELTRVCTGKYPCLGHNRMSPVTVAGKQAFEVINGFLWQSDATPKGTKKHEVLAAADPNTFRVLDGQLFLGATSVEGEQQLWETDGTVSGTRALSDGTPDQPFQVQGPPSQLAGALFVAADRKPVGSQLWRIANGQATQLTALRHLGAGIAPFFAAAVGDRVVMNGNNFVGLIGLAADGSAEPLQVEGDGCSSFFGGGDCPFEPVVVGSRLLFAQSGPEGELWSTDGTLAGTGSLGVDGVAGLGKLGDLALIFDTGGGLTVTDGSAEGTRFITQLGTDPEDTQVQEVGPPVSLGAQSFLFRQVTVTDDPSRVALELWRTDGTAAGTLRLASIPYDNNGFPFPTPVVLGGRLYFQFLGTVWRSDGSSEGTQPLSNQLPGGATALAAGTETLYATAGGAQQTLWAINPSTLAATQLVTSLRVGGGGVSSPLGSVLRNTLFFQVFDSQGAGRWWVTEGAPESTHQLPDFLAGDQDAEFFTAGDRRYFSACDSDHGCELWSTDRLGEDTRLVEDLWPGRRDSSPEILAVTGNAIFLAATEPTVGRELWKLDLSAAAAQNAARAKTTAPSHPLVSRASLGRKHRRTRGAEKAPS